MSKKHIAVAGRQLGETSGTATVLRSLLERFARFNDIRFTVGITAGLTAAPISSPGLHYREIAADPADPLRWADRFDREMAADPSIDLAFYPGIHLPAKARLRFINIIHDVMPFHLPEYYLTPWKLRQEKKLLRRCLAADHTVTVSQYSRDDILKRVPLPPERLTVIYNGIDRIFSPRARKSAPPVKGDYILYVGDLRRRKNLWPLVKALPLLPNPLGEELTFVFSGDGPARRKIVAYLERRGWSGRVIAAGTLSAAELPAYYRHAKLFVFPSLLEGFGLPVLEAQHSGVPVICGRHSSLAEVCGESAHYTNIRSPRAVAAAISELLTDPRLYHDYRERGLINSHCFDWDDSAESYRRLFQSVLSA